MQPAMQVWFLLITVLKVSVVGANRKRNWTCGRIYDIGYFLHPKGNLGRQPMWSWTCMKNSMDWHELIWFFVSDTDDWRITRLPKRLGWKFHMVLSISFPFFIPWSSGTQAGPGWLAALKMGLGSLSSPSWSGVITIRRNHLMAKWCFQTNVKAVCWFLLKVWTGFDFGCCIMRSKGVCVCAWRDFRDPETPIAFRYHVYMFTIYSYYLFIYWNLSHSSWHDPRRAWHLFHSNYLGGEEWRNALMMQRSASHSSKLMWQICKISPLRVRWMTVNVISWLLLLRVTVTVLEELTVLDAPKITKGWVVSPSKYQNCCCVAGPADPYQHGCLSALLKRPGLPMSPFAEPKKLGWKEMTNVYNKMILASSFEHFWTYASRGWSSEKAPDKTLLGPIWASLPVRMIVVILLYEFIRCVTSVTTFEYIWHILACIILILFRLPTERQLHGLILTVLNQTHAIQVIIVTDPQTWAEIDGALTDPFAIRITSLLWGLCLDGSLWLGNILTLQRRDNGFGNKF